MWYNESEDNFIKGVVPMTEEEKLRQNPMYDSPNCKTVQAVAEKAGYNMMCAGDEEKADIVLPGGDGCEKQVEVISKYGITAVCDETEEETAAAVDKAKAEYEAQEECDKPLVVEDAELCDTDEPATFIDLMSEESCRNVQGIAEKFGMNIMCPGDEAEPDVVLPGGDGCEKQVQVLGKYGVTAVCDELDDIVDAVKEVVADVAEKVEEVVEDVVDKIEDKIEETSAENPFEDESRCKVAQDIAEKFGVHIMCPGDERTPDIVLPGGEGCEKQVKVMSKYGVTAVCDEE